MWICQSGGGGWLATYIERASDEEPGLGNTRAQRAAAAARRRRRRRRGAQMLALAETVFVTHSRGFLAKWDTRERKREVWGRTRWCTRARERR